MNAPIADQQQREQALDISRSFIVQAPAGSGKTELISQRYLALLAVSDRPESVLAITFTRKAASEMRLRILNALEAAEQPAPDEAHKLKTWQLARTALDRDQQLNWQLLNNPGRLQVVTIDSFNASLTRQMPLLSKMGATVAPVDKPQPLFLEAARRTLKEVESRQWQADLAILMLHLGNNVERIQQLLVSMLARRDQWLRHLAGSNLSQDAQNSSRRGELEQALYQLVEDHLSKLQQAIPAGLAEELEALAEFAAQHVDSGKKPNIALWLEPPAASLGNQPEQLEYWQALAELLLTDKDEPRKRIDKTIGFPAASSEKDPQRKSQLQLSKEALTAVINEVAADAELVKLFANLRNMPALGYTDPQWQLLAALSRILLLSAAHLRIVFSEQGQTDFAEIAQSALQALGNETEPTELAMILDYQLQHILVDEFQDTSQGQFQLLQKLTHDWQADEGKTLFLVGDPMQSIYRFREAEVGLYLKARQQGIGNIRLDPLYLQVNFRSQQGIVEWVNHHLQSAFAQQEDISTGAVTYSASVPYHVKLEQQAVILHSYIERDDSLEADAVTQVVAQSLQSDSEDSIAILVRSRNHLLEIIEALKTAGIAFQAVDLDPLQEQRAVIDLYTLTRALHHFGDRLYWLALLRAPWCGLSLEDLLAIAEGPDPIIWNNCLDNRVQSTLSDTGRMRLLRLVSLLSPFLEQRGRLSLKSWTESIWFALGGQAIYTEKTDTQAISGYLDLLEKHEQGGRIHELALFNDALAGLYAPPDSLADGRLQIMTIHKSKGLEFGTVILPGLGRAGKHDEAGLLEWLERPNRFGDMDLLMSPIKASETDKNDSISQSLKAINKEKARHELTRLLYVALTRSKNHLHLFAHARLDRNGQAKAESHSLLAILWPQLSEHFNPEVHKPLQHDETKATQTDQYLQRIPPGWMPAIPLELPVKNQQSSVLSDTGQTDVEFDWATETARHVGTLTHRYLQQIADSRLHDWHASKLEQYKTAISNGLKNLGTDSNELAMATEKVLAALKHALSDERGLWILDKHLQAENEYALTAHEGNEFKRFIIDRTFVDENNIRWIIDYKTGSHEGSDKDFFLDREQQRYQPQLEHYAALMQQLDARTIKLGLYFPMLKGWREWQYAE